MATKADDVRNLTTAVASNYGISDDNLPKAFEYFCINLIARHPDFSGVLEGRDWQNADLSEFHCGGGHSGGDERGVDAVVYDPNGERVRLIQSKWTGKSNADALLTEAEAFFALLPSLVDSAYVDALGSARVRQVLREADLQPATQAITMSFMTNASIRNDEKAREIEQHFRDRYAESGWDVDCLIRGRNEIREMNRAFEAVEKSPTVDEVEIGFSDESAFTFDAGDHSALVIALKGNVVAQLFKRHSTQLFNANIRYGLAASKINQGMKRTLTDGGADDFFFFNNGITATCSEYERTDGGVRAFDFQVVNGAQTVSTLGPLLQQRPDESVFVLLRLISTGDKYGHKTEFADSVTRFQNTQNPVRVSDFFANDPFQLWLEANLAKSLSGKGVVPEFHYVRKRGATAKRGAGKPLTMEVLAALRHAIVNGPSISYAAPKSIWDPSTKPNAYWQAFGRGGDQCDTWSDEELAEVGWAYSLDQKVKADYRELDKENKERRYLNVLSRYVVGLVHRQVRSQLDATGSDFKEVIRNEKRFDEVTKRPYLEARKVLRAEYQARETASHYARQYIGKNEELFDTLTEQLRDALAMEGYFE